MKDTNRRQMFLHLSDQFVIMKTPNLENSVSTGSDQIFFICINASDVAHVTGYRLLLDDVSSTQVKKHGDGARVESNEQLFSGPTNSGDLMINCQLRQTSLEIFSKLALSLGAATCKLVNFLDQKVQSPLEVLQKSLRSPVQF